MSFQKKKWRIRTRKGETEIEKECLYVRWKGGSSSELRDNGGYVCVMSVYKLSLVNCKGPGSDEA